MAAQLTWYDILGILPGASADDVRRAVAARADTLRFELISGAPTKVLSATDRARKVIEAARQILADPERRRRYDEEIGLRPAVGGLDRPADRPSGADPGVTVRGGGYPAPADVLGVLADWLAPHPEPPRRVTVPDVRGLFVGPLPAAPRRAGPAHRGGRADPGPDAGRGAGRGPVTGAARHGPPGRHRDGAGMASAATAGGVRSYSFSIGA